MKKSKRYIIANEGFYNHYKTIQDRKIFIYDTLDCKAIKNYDIERLTGSNQIILSKDNKTIYNSDCDTFTSNSFVMWFTRVLNDIMNK